MDNVCYFCGAEIPEGLHVCPNCEKEITKKKRKYVTPTIIFL